MPWMVNRSACLQVPVDCNWIEVQDYSLREAAAVNGIDAKFFDVIEATKYSTIEKQMRKLIADKFIGNLDGEWAEENGYKLSSVRHGVYVILLGRDFEIDYCDGFTSPIVYVGKGGIRGRLLTHVRGKLFDFWRSIGGVPFRFFLTAFDPSGSDAPHLASSLESHLIELFR